MAVADSFQDLLTQGQAEAQSRRPDLLFADGDITVAQLHGAASMADACERFSAQSFRETFIDGASGDALTALVDDHYNIQRQAATQAQVEVEFSRVAATAGAGTIFAGTTIATGFGPDGEEVQYTTDTDAVFGALDLGPISVLATASVAGREGNADATEINRILDSIFDPTITVDNPAGAGGGNDEESDPELRERARNFFVTLRRGTLGAIEFGAKQVPSVRFARASEDPDTGLVTIVVSDSDGNSTAQMISDVIIELEEWRCAGTAISVVGGTRVLIDLVIEVTNSLPGFDVAAAEPDLIDATEARIERLNPEETMFLDAMIAAIIAVFPDDIFNITFTAITLTPGGAQAIDDVVPTTAQVLRPGNISFTAP